MQSDFVGKLVTCFFFAACLALGGGLSPVYADDDDTPSEVGNSPEDPIEAPDDDGSAGEVTNGSTDENDSTYWQYRYVHNNSGKGDPDDPDDAGTSAEWVSLKVKQPENESGDKKDEEEHRIIIDGVKKKNAAGNWVDVGETEPADGKGDKVRIVLDEPWEYCQTLRIKIHVEHRERQDESVYEDGKETYPWLPWEDDTTTAVRFNVVEMLDGALNEIKQVAAGDAPSGNSSGETGEQGSMDYVFGGLSPEPEFAATAVGAGDTGTYPAPDLVFSEGASWAMPTGTLKFVATGGAEFSAPPAGLQVIAHDADGNDAESLGDITLGTPTFLNGEIHVPVTYRDDTAILRVSIMVRGAEVVVPTGGYAGGTTIRYAIGGDCSGGVPVRMPPLLRIGGPPENDVFQSSAELETEFDDPVDPGVTMTHVGRYVHMARPHTTGVHTGYIDAIVLEESAAGTIRAGSFEITPVDGFSFVETEDTKLFVVNADNDSELEAFESGDIEVTSDGAIRVTLGTRAEVDTPLKLIILNPKLNLGEGPFVKFQNARVAVGGDAIRGGLDKTLLLVEGMHGTATDNQKLPQSPFVATELTALAEVETE